MEIKSSLINSKELKLLKDSLIAASEVDGKENFRVKLIEYVDDTADNEEDEFFYDMIEFCRFLKPDPETTAYTTPDHLIYLNAPGVFGEKVREWDFVYCHECLHQLWDTFGVEEQIKKNGIKYDHFVLNVASDCVINDYLSAIRKKSAPSAVILPEHLQKEYGVTYDRKVDTQFTLYLKLLEVAEKLRKDQKCQDAQDGGDGQEGQGGSPSGGSSSGSGSSGSGSSSDKNDNTAEGAQKSADEAKKAADKAQQNADSGKGSQKDADAAKEAAKEAQDAADRAKDAANKGDKEGEAKAAKEAKAAADRAKKLAGEDGKDGNNTAEGAQKSADEAKKAAGKAQQNADSGKGSQKDADAAKEAAKEAQDAANRAKEAANRGDKEGEAKAAQEAKAAADKAKKLAGEDGSESKDKASGGKGQGNDSPEGVEITGELTEEQKAQIRAKAEGVIKRYKDKITGVFGDFVKKCRNSVKCDPNGLANNTKKGKGAWNKQMDVAINAYVKKNLDKKRRQFEQTYKRVKRGSGIVKMGAPIIPGKRIKDDKMPINIAYYIDRSGSMEACIDKVFEAAFKISEALKQRFRKDKLVKSTDFRTFVFNTHMDEIKFGQTTSASGGTMGLDQILEFINKNTKNVLINIIITDAGFTVNENEIKNFLKTGVDGLVIFITNSENSEVKKIANEPDFKTKLIYILADADFNVE